MDHACCRSPRSTSAWPAPALPGPSALAPEQPPTPEELYAFTWNLATLLEAGLPLEQALAGLVAGTEEGPWHRTLQDLARAVTAGLPLSTAMARHPHSFSPSFRNMVAAGEASGLLLELLQIKACLLSRTTYLLGQLGYLNIHCPLWWFCIWGGFAWFLLAHLQVTADPDYGPLGLGSWVAVVLQGIVWSPAGAFLALGLIQSVRLALTRGDSFLGPLVETFLRALPGVAPLYTAHVTGQILLVWRTFLASGLPFGSALATSAATIGHGPLATQLQVAARRVWTGFTLASALEDVDLLPAAVHQAIRTGEQEGDLLVHLDQLRTWFMAESEHRAQVVAAILAPFGLLFDLVIMGSSLAAILVPVVTVLGPL